MIVLERQRETQSCSPGKRAVGKMVQEGLQLGDDLGNFTGALQNYGAGKRKIIASLDALTRHTNQLERLILLSLIARRER
jgi:hypothetical protein